MGFLSRLAAVATASSLALIATVLLSGCEKKPLPPPEAAAPVTDAAQVFFRVGERAAGVDRMDAALEARVQGAPAPYRGRFYGTLRMERSGDSGLDLWLQVYTVLGVPALEVIVEEDRIEVFSPLERTVFLNFEELISGENVEEFPLSSFDRAVLPLDLIMDQVKLIWGLEVSESYRYELIEGGESYLISEWNGLYLRREMEYSKPHLHLQRVRIYQGGIALGGMDCEGYGPGDSWSGFFPRNILFYQNELQVSLKFSQFRVNMEVTGPRIEFREPSRERLILLTPPVP